MSEQWETRGDELMENTMDVFEIDDQGTELRGERITVLSLSIRNDSRVKNGWNNLTIVASDTVTITEVVAGESWTVTEGEKSKRYTRFPHSTIAAEDLAGAYVWRVHYESGYREV